VENDFKMNINKNTGLKIASIILAVLLWALIPRPGLGDIVRLNTDIEYPIIIPVEVRGLDSGLLLAEEPPLVLLTVRPLIPALALDVNLFTAYVDVKGRLPGTNTMTVQVPEVPGFQIRSIEPSSVRIELIKSHSKSLPVQLGLINQPTECSLRDIKSVPSTVTLQGSMFDLNLVEKVMALVEPLPQSGIQSFIVSVLAVDYKGTLVPGLSVDPDEVTVQLTCE
jgi:YbbR domain-containing protein